MKRAVQNAMRMGALGISVDRSGRLGGAEIARTEWYSEGRVPRHTLRADIDYSVAESTTAYGNMVTPSENLILKPSKTTWFECINVNGYSTSI